MRIASHTSNDDVWNTYVNEIVVVEDVVEVTEMPTTASPLFLVGMAGGGFLALGGLLSAFRRRRA